MSLASLFGVNLAVIAGCMVLLWLLSLALRNASIVDIFWGLGFVVVGGVTYARSAHGLHATLLFAMAASWGLRLSGYLALRNIGKEEDHRYQMLRRKYAPFWWKSLFIVFGLQGVLLFIVSLPLQLGQAARAGVVDGVVFDNAVVVVGVVVFAVGFLWESIADAQLMRFKRDPQNAGRVMDRGLWGWSRHPNYFGEMVLWWGIGLVALGAPHGAWALLGPATITFLLLRVSGVPMLETALKTRRPGYDDYIARTPALWPRPPRKSA